MIVNAHARQRSPDYGEYPASLSMWLMETSWFSHRPLWTFIMSGVFDRFPALRLVLAEQGSGWIRDALDIDGRLLRARSPTATSGSCGSLEPQLLERMPSEYWADELPRSPRASCTATTARGGIESASTTSCGAATTRTSRAPLPFSTEAIQHDVRRRSRTARCAAMLGGNAAARLRLRPRAARAAGGAVRADRRRSRRRARRRSRRRGRAWPSATTHLRTSDRGSGRGSTISSSRRTAMRDRTRRRTASSSTRRSATSSTTSSPNANGLIDERRVDADGRLRGRRRVPGGVVRRGRRGQQPPRGRAARRLGRRHPRPGARPRRRDRRGRVPRARRGHRHDGRAVRRRVQPDRDAQPRSPARRRARVQPVGGAAVPGRAPSAAPA